MKHGFILSVSSVMLVLCGCETIQTPQQRQRASARQQAAARMSEERMYKVQGRVESMEMEYGNLTRQIQQLQEQVRSSNSQIAQLNSQMQSLEAKQAREMKEVVSRVEKLLGQAVASRPSSSSRGAGYEHVVEARQTLSVIAQAYGTTVSAIKKANNLKNDTIYVGQKLFIPE